MQNNFLLTISLILAASVTAQDDSGYVYIPNTVSLQILQGEKVFDIRNNVKNRITLKPAPFKMKFTFVHGAYISARSSVDSQSFATPANDDFKDCENMIGSMGAESSANSQKLICTYSNKEAGTLGWFYYDDTTTRFDANPTISGDTIICYRTVDSILLFEKYQIIPINKFKHSLFLVFYDPNFETCLMGVGPPKRIYLKLSFKK